MDWLATLPNSVLPAYLIAINVLAFFVYAADKFFAKVNGARRVREVTLLMLALVGGSLGALLAMRMFHHKTSKNSFFVPFLVILLLQIALGVYIYQWTQNLGPVTIGN